MSDDGRLTLLRGGKLSWSNECRKKRPAEPHDCPLCGKGFPTRSVAAHHILRVHGGGSASPTSLHTVAEFLARHARGTASHEEVINDRIGAPREATDAAAGHVAAAVGTAHSSSATSSSGEPALEAVLPISGGLSSSAWRRQLSWPATVPHQCPCCLRCFSTRDNAVHHIGRLHLLGGLADGGRASSVEDIAAFLERSDVRGTSGGDASSNQVPPDMVGPGNGNVVTLSLPAALRSRTAMLREVMSRPFVVTDTIDRVGGEAFLALRQTLDDELLLLPAAGGSSQGTSATNGPDDDHAQSSPFATSAAVAPAALVATLDRVASTLGITAIIDFHDPCDEPQYPPMMAWQRGDARGQLLTFTVGIPQRCCDAQRRLIAGASPAAPFAAATVIAAFGTLQRLHDRGFLLLNRPIADDDFVALHPQQHSPTMVGSAGPPETAVVFEPRAMRLGRRQRHVIIGSFHGGRLRGSRTSASLVMTGQKRSLLGVRKDGGLSCEVRCESPQQ